MIGLLEYPFPLRPDCIVYIRLPPDVTAEEIERIAKMMRLLPVQRETSSVYGIQGQGQLETIQGKHRR